MALALTAYLSLTASVVHAGALQNPKLGSPERTALLDCLREDKIYKDLAKEWKIKKVIFFQVKNWVKDGWAYVQASPGTPDNKQNREPSEVVLHQVNGKWEIVDWVPDSIGPADNPDEAFKTWHEEFVKKHKGCPSEIFPKNF